MDLMAEGFLSGVCGVCSCLVYRRAPGRRLRLRVAEGRFRVLHALILVWYGQPINSRQYAQKCVGKEKSIRLHAFYFESE